MTNSTWNQVGPGSCDGECGWNDILDDITDLLADDDYYWAEDTLTGIHDWILKHKHVTMKQKQAIEKIRKSPDCAIDATEFDLY